MTRNFRTWPESGDIFREIGQRMTQERHHKNLTRNQNYAFSNLPKKRKFQNVPKIVDFAKISILEKNRKNHCQKFCKNGFKNIEKDLVGKDSRTRPKSLTKNRPRTGPDLTIVAFLPGDSRLESFRKIMIFTIFSKI